MRLSKVCQFTGEANLMKHGSSLSVFKNYNHPPTPQGDVIKFFAPNIPKEVEILKDKTGRPSGEAYADFYTHAEATTAMTNNNKPMGEWNKPSHYPNTGTALFM